LATKRNNLAVVLQINASIYGTENLNLPWFTRDQYLCFYRK